MSRRSELAAFAPGADVSRGTSRRRGELTPEAAAKKQITDGLKARGIFFRRIGVGRFRVGKRFVNIGDAGVPDLIALVPGGRTLWIEVKSKRGKLSPGQVAFRNACLRTGNLHLVAYDWDGVEPFLGVRR